MVRGNRGVELGLQTPEVMFPSNLMPVEESDFFILQNTPIVK